MITYEKDQVILSGKTEKSFANKLHHPEKATIDKRNKYFKELKNRLSIKTVDGKIYIK